MSTPRLVDGIVDETVAAAKREGIELEEFGRGQDIERTFESPDRFEDRFYERMAAEMGLSHSLLKFTM